jgi:hypothetical protein
VYYLPLLIYDPLSIKNFYKSLYLKNSVLGLGLFHCGQKEGGGGDILSISGSTLYNSDGCRYSVEKAKAGI